MGSISDRLASIRETIRGALRRAGDPDRAVRIVAVTKNHPPEVVDEVARAGLADVGENRVQEALAKAPRVRAAGLHWHLIGHLQRNKVARALELFATIHSVDSPRLVDALAAAGRPVEVFLQVNVSGEAAKYGVAPADARGLWQHALAAGLAVTGLMTMAPWTDDPERVRPVFRTLRELRDDLIAAGDGPPPRHLSMGMSGDYAVAVEEGATHVRIGSALVG